ncbi:hypothetical protein DYE49_02670 [Treponema rectale]|uniref:MBG domain-containing protein n=1 Tax=Treponema rectale TaxID=744512 RepID=A0A7M1XJ40_9SPIR|nr:hypothetical protein DYE49_02670 [Treponema rectale]
MRYEEYENKIRKRAKAKRILRFFRLPLIGLSVLIVALIVTLLQVKGIVTEETQFMKTYTYGESFSATASTFLDGDVIYEYCLEGSNDWTTDPPKHPGNYQARAVSSNGFGVPTYGAVQTFSIEPLKAEVEIATDKFTYGNQPVISYHLEGRDEDGLFMNDTIVDYSLNYDDFSKSKTSVQVDKSSIKVVNQEGEDISDCYDFICKPRDVTILPIPLTIQLESAQKIYDGKELTADGEGTIIEGKLLDGDRILSMPKGGGSFITPGEYPNINTSAEVNIVNQSGIDVTNHYNIKIISGVVEIKSRPLTVYTEDVTYEYNGLPFETPEPKFKGELAPGHTIEFTNIDQSEYKYVTKQSIDFDYQIFDENNQDVTGFYDVKKHVGTFEIKPREIQIQAKSQEIYVSDHQEAIDIEDYTIYQGKELGEGDKLSIICKITSPTTRSYSIGITNEENEDVTNNYFITPYGNNPLDDSLIQFKKHEIRVEYQDHEKVYDGNPIENKISDAKIYIDGQLTDGDLPSGDKVVLDESAFKTPTDAGTYTYNPTVKVITSGTEIDRSSYYDIKKTTEAKLEINPRPVQIVISATDAVENKKVYDGDPFDFSFECTGLSDQLDASGLLPGHSLKTYRDPYGYDSDAGEKDVQIGGNTIYIGNEEIECLIEDDSETDVTKNYDISFSYQPFIIERRTLNLNFKNVEKWYDGTPYNFENLPYDISSTGDGLLPGDEVVISSTETCVNPGSYDLASRVKYSIMRDDGTKKIDVTSNYQITANFDSAQLTIKKAKLVYIVSTPSDRTYMDHAFDFSSDYSDDGYKVHLTYQLIKELSSYPTSEEGYDLASGTITSTFAKEATNQPEELQLSAKNFAFVANGNVSDCDDISQSEMDVVISESSNLDFQVKKREYSIDVSDFTYYYSSLDNVGFQNVKPTRYEERNDDANALGLITSHNLIEGHKVLMTWKNGVKTDIGTYSFKDDFKYSVYDSTNRDVTANYQLNLEASNFGTLTIDKMELSYSKSYPEDVKTVRYPGKNRYQEGNTPFYHISDVNKGPDISSLSAKSTAIIDDGNDEVVDIGAHVISLDTSVVTWKITSSRSIQYQYERTNQVSDNDFIISNLDELNDTHTVIKGLIHYSFDMNMHSHFADGRYFDLSDSITNDEKYYVKPIITSSDLPSSYSIRFKLKDGVSVPTVSGTYDVFDYFEPVLYDDKNMLCEKYDLVLENANSIFTIDDISLSIEILDNEFYYDFDTLYQPQENVDYRLSYTNLPVNSYSYSFKPLSISRQATLNYEIDTAIYTDTTNNYQFDVDISDLVQLVGNVTKQVKDKKEVTFGYHDVELLYIPGFNVYDSSYYLLDEYFYFDMGDYIQSNDKVVVTCDKVFGASLTTETITFADLDVKVMRGERDVTRCYDINVLPFTVSVVKPNATLDFYLNSSDVSKVYNGPYSSDYLQQNDFAYSFNCPFNVSDVTFVFDEPSSEFLEAYVGSYQRHIVGFTCKLDIYPSVTIDGIEVKRGKTSTSIIYDSNDESYLTNSFSENEYGLTINIEKRVAHLQFATDSQFVDIDNLSGNIPLPSVTNLASGDNMFFDIHKDRITQPGDYLYWDIVEVKWIFNKKNVDVLFCYDIDIVTPNFTLIVYEEPKW